MTDTIETPKIIEVADRFYVRQEIDNIAWIDLGGFAVIIDTLEHKEKELDVVDAMVETISLTPVRYIINTHTHYDHVALNEAFSKRFDSEILNQEITPVDSGGRWIEGDSRRLEILPMPDCHTPEDWIIHAPDDRVLFIGDIFGWGCVPLITNLREDNVHHLLNTIDKLAAYDVDTIVPGHGPLCTTETLSRWGQYLRWLIDGIAVACAGGASDIEIENLFPPPEDMKSWWRFLDWKHADTIAKVIKSTRKNWL